MTKYLKEQGYEIQRYFTGQKEKTFNLHFRGDYVKTFNTQKEAEIGAVEHDKEHQLKLSK